MKTSFSYAVQIQPLNGDELVEFQGGLTFDAIAWSPRMAHRYPQAARQVGSGCELAIDRQTRTVYYVPSSEVPWQHDVTHDHEPDDLFTD